MPDKDTTDAPTGARQADRQWTLDELADAHPLAGDWEWMPDGRRGGVQLFAAVLLDHDYGEPEVSSIVYVDSAGALCAEPDPAPADVCLSVILASMGLDALPDGEAQT